MFAFLVNFGYIMGMEKQKKRNLLKETLLTEWMFFCVYWGIFAIIWHFASYITFNDTGKTILYESGILTPIFAIGTYLVGAYFALILPNSPTSRSPEPSDKQPQSQT